MDSLKMLALALLWVAAFYVFLVLGLCL